MTSAVWASHDRYSTATAPSAECTGNSARRSAGLKLSHCTCGLMIFETDARPVLERGSPEGFRLVHFIWLSMCCLKGKVFPSLFSNRLVLKGAGYCRSQCSTGPSVLLLPDTWLPEVSVPTNLNGELAGGNALCHIISLLI